jgi:1-acyl-sn-glycerol-3-phosphate acyltransferase
MAATVSGFLLRLIGWKAVWIPPPSPKSVIIAYPHTSNWDFPITMLWRFAIGFPMHWVGKQSMFENPLGGLFKRWGGVPVDRSRASGFIDQLLVEYGKREIFHLTIAAEGTRSKTDHLKSGFYRLALAANVPVGLGFIDYRQKAIGIERWLILTGDREIDLKALRDYYTEKTGRHPAQAGEIRFKD